MNKRKVAVGPGASSLILIAVVLALSVLTVLTMISARNDEALALRSVETREEVFGLFTAGEQSLAKLDAVLVSCLSENPEDPDAYLAAVKENLPEGMKLKRDVVSWIEESDNRTLECAVRVNEPGAENRYQWTMHSLTAGDIWEDDGFEDFDDWGDDDDWGDEEEDEDLEDEDSEDDEIEDEESEDEEIEDEAGETEEDGDASEEELSESEEAEKNPEEEKAEGSEEENQDGEEEFE